MTSLEKDAAAMELVQELLDQATTLLMANLPAMKEIATQMVDVVFTPKTIAKQLALAVALQMGAVSISQVMAITRWLFANFSSKSRLIRQLNREQGQAVTQDEWMDLAERIDNIQGNDVWRQEDSCRLYEGDRISARIDEFVHLMRRRDIFELMFTVRGGLNRNKFGLLHEGLFSKALAGSKVLVETYHNVVCAALDLVCDAPVVIPGDAPIPTEARLAFFNEARHAYGRTAFIASGGAALGFYHVGVVKCLMENGLMPRVLGGSSAGSIVCAMIGTRTDEECVRDMFNVEGTNAPGHSGDMQITFFAPVQSTAEKANEKNKESDAFSEVYHNTAGAFHDAKRTWQLLMPIGIRRFSSLVYDILTLKKRPQDILNHDTEYLRNCIRTNVGNFTFQEAFDRTGRILNITVTPKNSSDPPRLLNYLTAPHVVVWSAALASASLPGVFEANKLMVKDADGTERFESSENATFSDGSMEQDLPMQQLSEMFNVNHFIISQANPHAVMFASFSLNKSVWSSPIVGMMTGVLLFLKDQVRAWFSHMVELVGGRRIAPLFDTRRGIASQFFTQEYEGRDCDISLIPWMSHRSFLSALLHCIYNPSQEEFMEWVLAAERETWKQMPAIKSHIAEEVTLDRCVQRLRRRLLVESWEKHRQMTSSTEVKMGDRVPSFFTSPSLVNMSGLGIWDRASLSDHDLKDSAQQEYDRAQATNGGAPPPPPAAPATLPPIDLQPGWAGMGLRGCHSSASLAHSDTHGSGVFYDHEDEGVDVQEPGELTTASTRSVESLVRSGSGSGHELDTLSAGQYVKTSTMANFYYRRSQDYTPGIRESQSHERLQTTAEENPAKQQDQRLSQSSADLPNYAEETPTTRNRKVAD